MKKKLTSLIISLVLVLSSFAVCFASEPISDYAKIYSKAGIVIDMTTGEVLYSQNATEQMYPASITKIMTCILALEKYPGLEGTVEVSSVAAGVGGNTLNLKKGEKISLKDLVYGTMVISANDGAVAIAEYVSGSVEEFAKLMNKKAAAIGAINTHYVNPNGLHDDDHYTTAYDIALIARYCMQNETFRDIVSSVSYTIPQTNLSSSRTVQNTNWLLYDTVDTHMVYVGNEKRYCKYDGCIGIKTGNTLKAGCCLVTAATRGTTTILAVTLKASNVYERFADGIKLLDLGLNNYKTVSAIDENKALGTVNVKRGSVKTVDVVAEKSLYATLRSTEKSTTVTTKVELVEEIKAPVSAGAILGTIYECKDGVVLATCSAIAKFDVPKGGILSIFGIDDMTAAKIFKVIKIIGTILLIFIAIVAVWVIWKRQQIKKKKARKAARLKAKEEALKRQTIEENRQKTLEEIKKRQSEKENQ